MKDHDDVPQNPCAAATFDKSIDLHDAGGFAALAQQIGGTVVAPSRLSSRVDPLSFGLPRPVLLVDLDEVSGTAPLPHATVMRLRRAGERLDPLAFGPVTPAGENGR